MMGEGTVKPTRCERKGHKWKVRIRRGLVKECDGLGFRCVADKVSQRRQECRRCGESTEWETTFRECRSGVSLDERSHEELFGSGETWW